MSDTESNNEVVLKIDEDSDNESLNEDIIIAGVDKQVEDLNSAAKIDIKKQEEELGVIKQKIAEAKASEDNAKKQAREVLEKIRTLCFNRKNTIKDIEPKLGSSDISKFPEIHDDAKNLFKKFENDVQEQENKIKSLEDELKDITIDKFEEFEMEVERIKPYADNKKVFEDLDTSMKKREDELEDEKIIYDVHAIIDNKVSENTEYTQEKKEEDKEKVSVIVKDSLKEMLEETDEEIDKFKEYITTENEERKKILREQLGRAKYNLSPHGVDAVYQYITDKEPKPKEGKKVTQIHREYNIDILNLLLGGLLTQYYVDKIISMDNIEDVLDKRIEEGDSRMDLLKEKIDMFTDVVVKQNPKKIEEIANNIKKEKNKEGSFGKRRTNFGFGISIIENLKKRLFETADERILKQRESQCVIEILSKLTREDAEEFKKDMEEEMKNVSIDNSDVVFRSMQKDLKWKMWRSYKSKIKNKKRRILKKMFNTQNFNLTDKKAKIENVLNIIYALEYLYDVDKNGIVTEKNIRDYKGKFIFDDISKKVELAKDKVKTIQTGKKVAAKLAKNKVKTIQTGKKVATAYPIQTPPPPPLSKEVAKQRFTHLSAEQRNEQEKSYQGTSDSDLDDYGDELFGKRRKRKHDFGSISTKSKHIRLTIQNYESIYKQIQKKYEEEKEKAIENSYFLAPNETSNLVAKHGGIVDTFKNIKNRLNDILGKKEKDIEQDIKKAIEYTKKTNFIQFLIDILKTKYILVFDSEKKKYVTDLDETIYINLIEYYRPFHKEEKLQGLTIYKNSKLGIKDVISRLKKNYKTNFEEYLTNLSLILDIEHEKEYCLPDLIVYTDWNNKENYKPKEYLDYLKEHKEISNPRLLKQILNKIKEEQKNEYGELTELLNQVKDTGWKEKQKSLEKPKRLWFYKIKKGLTEKEKKTLKDFLDKQIEKEKEEKEKREEEERKRKSNRREEEAKIDNERMTKGNIASQKEYIEKLLKKITDKSFIEKLKYENKIKSGKIYGFVILTNERGVRNIKKTNKSKRIRKRKKKSS